MNDISQIEGEYRRSVEKLAGGESDPKDFAEVSRHFHRLFELMKMILIMKKDRYYGYFLMNLSLKTDFRMRFPAAVSIDKMPFVMKVNPILMSKYSVKEMIFILCHEIEHLVLDHPAQGKGINKTGDPQNQKLLNLAMDASVNDRLIMEMDKYGLRFMGDPGDGITSEVLGRNCGKALQPLREFTYYYHNFPEGGRERIGGLQENPHEWTKREDPEEVREMLRLFVKTVVAGIPQEDRDKLPVHQRERIEELLKPPGIRWQDVLRRYTGSIPDGFQKTKTRLNRRQPERWDVSGRKRGRTVRLVIALDTSGSMTPEMITRVFREIFGILKHVHHEITVIECDMMIQRVYKVRSEKDVSPEIEGRGGTSFRPVIDYINEDGRFRDAVLVYFTDGYGDDQIPRPRTFRNLWVLTEEGSLSLEEPYGEVIRMEADA